MPAPPVHYARSENGVQIAYSVLGEGRPLVYLQPFTHQQLDWTVPEFQDWLSALAANRQLVRYDLRRFGLSTRTEEPISPDSLVADLEAVVDRAALQRFDLFGISGMGLVAMAYAARHPERVERLIVWGSAPRGADIIDTSRVAAMQAARRIDTELAYELHARVMFGDAAVGRPECMTHARDSHNPADKDSYNQAIHDFDVSADLAKIACPTLCVLPQGLSYSSIENQQALAAAIPECEVSYCEGGIYPHWGLGAAGRLETFNAFLRPDEPRDSRGGGDVRLGPRAAAASAFRTILFTDLESSTALTQTFGDAKAQEILRGHNDAVRTALEAHGGEEVKHTGDGIMAAFGSAVSAVAAALQIQGELAGAEVRVRVGLNAGEPVAEDDDYFGAAVQLAARVCDRAEPGQVLVPSVVRDLCRGKGFSFEDQGETTLKGFPEPVRLFVVGEAD